MRFLLFPLCVVFFSRILQSTEVAQDQRDLDPTGTGYLVYAGIYYGDIRYRSTHFTEHTLPRQDIHALFFLDSLTYSVESFDLFNL